MPIESATNISQLVSTNPAGSDMLSSMDNHVRLIKSTLLNTFPDITGLATQAEAQAGTISTKVMTPLRTKEAFTNFCPVTTAGTYTKLTINALGQVTGGTALTSSDLPQNPTITGTLTLTATGSAGIELGRTDGTASTPFIDFHSGTTATSYDARILASGGTGAAGAGTLTYSANLHTLSGDVAVTSGGTYATASATDGTIASGATYRPTPIGGNFKTITNNAAFTFASPNASGVYTIVVEITNGTTAGTITWSGFAKVVGQSFLTTTNGNRFQIFITKTAGGVTANVIAMQ